MFQMGNTNIFQENDELLITPGSVVSSSQRPRRIYRCSHCRQEGHNRSTCPQLESERERARESRRRENLERTQQLRTHIAPGNILSQPPISCHRPIKIYNNSEYNLSIYWSQYNREEPTRISMCKFKYLGEVGGYSTTIMKFTNNHRFIAIPYNECPLHLNSLDINDTITFDENKLPTIFFDCVVKDISIIDPGTQDEQSIVVIEGIHDYIPPKTPLEQWKEMAFKSYYLLTELQRMGASSHENLEPMMDMVQDIKIPEHNQFDREFAGVPSSFTNIT